MNRTTRQLCRLLVVLTLTVSGCAAHKPSTTTSSALAQNGAGTQPSAANDAKSMLPLDQIDPKPTLPSPATQPATQPSVDALVLYAKSRDAQALGQRYIAINSLEKAIALDPTSYDLYYDLGKAYLAVANVDDRSIAAFEHAAAIEPNHLDLQIQLGRQYLTKGNLPKAILHLRMALLTSDYATDDGQAAVADFYLARALKDGGYDRAALDQYDVLLQRMKNPSLTIRQNAELAYLIDRPELMLIQIGELYEKHGDYADALKAYQPAADRDPDNVELKTRVARNLASLGRRDDALALAADLIVRSRASPDSLATLRDICRRLNLPNGEVDALRKLHEQHPNDRAILFALSDILVSQGKTSEAEHLLFSAWEHSAGDMQSVQITRRLVAMYTKRGAVEEAARVLVISLQRDPDALRNLSPLWSQLLHGTGNVRFHLSTLQAMHVASDVEPAKEFWISKLAELDHRDALAKSALQRSVSALPPFAPAYRAQVLETWAQDDLSTEQKITAADHLAAAASAAGNASLAEEVRGLSLLNQKKSSAAVDSFAKAVKLGGKSPDLLLSYALAGRTTGKDPQFEKVMWKLISDHPLYEDGYAVLFRYYAGSDVHEINDAMKVLSTWLTADPQSITARVIEANVESQLGRPRDAESNLSQLFAEDPHEPGVLDSMQVFYMQAGRINDYIAKLEDYRSKHPGDTVIIARLVNIYAEQKRIPEATRLLDTTRTAVADDPDLLYEIAQLYARLDEKPAAEAVLQQVVKLDPGHAGASNDLGFSWADEGKNLPQAESLIRVAVTAEPDNQSFLDSLGWVLYKRGKFAEARKYLEEAVAPAAFPDPVVLDHLGDTLYRLSQTDAATKQWQRSLKGIGDEQVDRSDLKQLRQQLQKKLKQADAKQPVDVSPVIEAASTAQAKE